MLRLSFLSLLYKFKFMRFSLPANSHQATIRHGVQYLSRDKQPSMFQLLAWKQTNNAADNKEWLIKLSPTYSEGRFTDPPIYERPRKLINTQRQGELIKEERRKRRGQQIKQSLYYYGDESQLKQDRQKEQVVTKNKDKVNIPQKEKKRLDAFDDREKRQIEVRKINIKQFTKSTRQLPNSAFTTYFGKPAFSNYAAANNAPSIADRKTYSVMPHAGINQPAFTQTHRTALNKANVINLQSHVPRNPLPHPHIDQYAIQLNEYYNVEIVKPDLINQDRFTHQDKSLHFKVRTPRHDQINQIPKRHYQPFKPLTSHNKKQKKGLAKSEQKGDGLAFMNRRQHFMRQLQQQKKNKQRLAYKVTECYPLDWDFKQSIQSTHAEEKWNKLKPAGQPSQSLSNPTNFIYR